MGWGAQLIIAAEARVSHQNLAETSAVRWRWLDGDGRFRGPRQSTGATRRPDRTQTGEAFPQNHYCGGEDREGGDITELEAARRRALTVAAHALRCDGVTAEVLAALEDVGVATILLKGPSIARWLYPTGGRSYGDTDLLVAASDFDRAEAVLRSLGFRGHFDGFHPLERVANPVETPFNRPAGPGGGPPAIVDLHHNLPLLPTADDALWDAFREGAEVMEVGGVEAPVLGRPALALHVVLHAVQHDFGLHTDEDLRRAIAVTSADEWASVARLAQRLGVADVLGFGLRRHARGAEIADRLGLANLSPADSPYWVASAPRGAPALAELLAAPTWRGRWQRLRWTLLPTPARLRHKLGRPGARGASLVIAYGRLWWEMAAAVVPAVDFVRRRRA